VARSMLQSTIGMARITLPLQRALEQARLNAVVAHMRDLSGGCIHQVIEITLEDGAKLVAKIARAEQATLFKEEQTGLRMLAETDTVIVPRPLAFVTCDGAAVLLLEAIRHADATTEGWRRFGEDLAALHIAEAGEQYGFEMDNHCGMTPQPNDWSESWVEFNREYRLGHQLRLAESAGVLRSDEARYVRGVIEHLDVLIPDRPKPALLHGDLWSGNALPTVDDEGDSRVAVIDPATYIGDGWADIAMMQLFGGFSSKCFEAYTANVTDRDQIDTRIAVYQLYHVLNHVNLFGRGYAGQAMAIVDRLARHF
jgi:fructosamine-3-kinase